MATSRRTILAIAAGGLTLAAAGGVWRVTRTPASAVQPWEVAGPVPDDIRLDAFRHAILAPNPHNMQPWVIRLDEDAGATIFCDLDRRLPMTDPFDRQITIGFGCFLELARIAAAERGYKMVVTAFPDGESQRLDQRPVASIQFFGNDAAAPDPLYAAIPIRRSNKLAFDMDRTVLESELAPLKGAASGVADGTTVPEKVAAIRTIVLEAVGIEYRLPRAHGESVKVMRIGHAEIDASPDGIALDGAMIEAMTVVGAIDRAALADPASMAWKTGADMMASTYGSAPAFLWIVTPDNDRESQLRAGADYARMNLAATVAGLAMHPMSQSLQEYAEVAGPFAAIHQLLAPDGGTVQMLARVGHGPAVGPSPRWPLEAKLA